MINEKSVIGLIPARGGSKRLLGKNKIPLAGRPLLSWTIKAAKNSPYIDRTILSTDDAAIAEIAKAEACEVPFMRPDHLATDDASSEDVTLHLLQTLNIADGYLVLLQPTSPLRTSADIDGCIELCSNQSAPGVVTVTPPEKPGHWMLFVDDQQRIKPAFPEAFHGATPAPKTVFPNGAVFVVDIAGFLKNPTFWPDGVLAYDMPASRSIDIDTADDLKRAEELLTP